MACASCPNTLVWYKASHCGGQHLLSHFLALLTGMRYQCWSRAAAKSRSLFMMATKTSPRPAIMFPAQDIPGDQPPEHGTAERHRSPAAAALETMNPEKP